MPSLRTRTALAVTLAALSVHAEPCARPDLLETFPSDGAKGVPTNAVPFARYEPTAQYLGEDVELEEEGLGAEVVPACFDENQGMLSLAESCTGAPVSTRPLEADRAYTITWPALRGVGTASLGRGAKVTFHTATGEDTESPRFDGLLRAEWDVRRKRDACTDSQEERFVFDLVPGDASDDSGTGSLALLVFQTRGPGIDEDAPPHPVLTTHLPEPGSAVRLELPESSAAGEVCFAAPVRDLTGKTSGGADRTACVTTRRSPFFRGCSSSATPSPVAAPWWPAAILAFALCRRRRAAP